MTFSNFDAVFYTLAFLVPGYLMFWIFSLFVPQRENPLQSAFLRYLFFSCLNYALWSSLLFYLSRINYADHHPYRWFLIMIGVTLISPMLLGTLFAWIIQQQWLRNLIFKISKNSIHPIPTAWDYKMSKLSNSWIVVTLNDGSIVLGWYGSNSFSSSIAGERDLLLESVYQMDDNGAWSRRSKTDGIWIPAGQIKWIEFFSDEEEVNVDEQRAEPESEF